MILKFSSHEGSEGYLAIDWPAQPLLDESYTVSNWSTVKQVGITYA
jgi:hypothetical protein